LEASQKAALLQYDMADRLRTCDGKVIHSLFRSTGPAESARFSVDSNPSFNGFTAPPSAALNRLMAVTKTSCLLNIRRLGWFNGGPDGSSALDRLTALNETCAGLADEANAQQSKID
jgi:hypothetical protein